MLNILNLKNQFSIKLKAICGKDDKSERRKDIPAPICFVKALGMGTQLCLNLCDPMDCVAHQVPLSMGFSRQEYWSGLLFPSAGESSQPRD